MYRWLFGMKRSPTNISFTMQAKKHLSFIKSWTFWAFELGQKTRFCHFENYIFIPDSPHKITIIIIIKFDMICYELWILNKEKRKLTISMNRTYLMQVETKSNGIVYFQSVPPNVLLIAYRVSFAMAFVTKLMEMWKWQSSWSHHLLPVEVSQTNI